MAGNISELKPIKALSRIREVGRTAWSDHKGEFGEEGDDPTVIAEWLILVGLLDRIEKLELKVK